VIVYFHGTGLGTQDIPFPDIALALGVHVVMFDRPGYGSSTPRPDASLLDIAQLVLDELDRLGVDRFSVLGWSGGGPHALACAALMSGRIRAVGLLSSWATMSPPDPSLPAGVRLAMRAAPILPRSALRLMFSAGTWFGVAPRPIGARRTSNVGWVDDVRRVARPWGFDVARVTSSVRVLAWHAEGDRQVPITPWKDVPGAELTVLPGAAHDVASEVWEIALRRVTHDERS
jgi:pimeloyl-ACP methyl ester carboxylesterase